MIQKEVEKEAKCFHCGDSLPSEPVYFEDKPFCCKGCKTVYEVLSGGGFCEYYEINKAPGVKQAESNEKDFNFLDDPAVKTRFIRYSDEELSIAQFYIPGMHCSSCIWLLENLYKMQDGVYESKVNFSEKQLTVKFAHHKLKLSQLVKLLKRIGYKPNLSLSDEKSTGDKEYSYELYKKLGLAGFSFGNIMLLSFPEYLGFEGSDASLQFTFRILIFLLALPVLFYSSSDYFRSAIAAVKEKIINIDIPLTLGIIALFGRSTYELFFTSSPGYMDSFAGLIFFLLIGKLFQHKTFESLNFERTYQSYFPLSVTVDGINEEVTILIGKLKTGDTIIIHNQEIIPADSVLLEGDALIDYSFVTGESSPVPVGKNAVIYAGGKQTAGRIKLIVTNPTSESYLTNLWNDSTLSKRQSSKYSDFSNLVSKYFTIIILLLAIGASMYYMFYSVAMAVNVFTAILIIACPCALALSTPFTFGSAQRLLTTAGLYVKNPILVEKLADIDTIVFDKTGTLTGLESLDVTYIGDPLDEITNLNAAAVCRESVHPLSRAIYRSLALNSAALPKVRNFSELNGFGIEGEIYGVVYKLGSRSFLNDERADKLSAELRRLSGTKVFLSINGKTSGCYIVSSVIRESVPEMIQKVEANNDVYVLSGDSSKQSDLMQSLFKDDSKLHFGKTPYDKKEFIKSLKKQGKTVLMIGDGLNDSGAIASADCGISVTEDISGFTPAGDAILVGKEVKKLSDMLLFTKDSMIVIKISFIISALYNIVGLAYAISGSLTPLFAAVLMPLSSLTVILVTTTGTFLAALKRKLIR